ncbi:MAG TPA: hypothetical protein VJ570_08680 [Holophagaceae bacterium]|nr:hypothetical protein [Holophagaceae bacterium]
MEPRRPREPRSVDTAEFAYEEILERLELGRLIVQATEQGSRLATVHSATPEPDRRAPETGPAHPDRRTFAPIDLPTRFPESGPIHLLLVGGFADDAALRRPVPYWEDDHGGACLVWQALYRSGLIHPDDRDFAMGLGGFWDDRPPRTLDLAMTYSGYRRRGEPAEVDRVLHPWNQQRLQTLALACHERSSGRLRIIALGDVARHLMCTAAYGVPGIAVLSLPEPTKEELAEMHTRGAAAEKWVDWAASLLAVGRG